MSRTERDDQRPGRTAFAASRSGSNSKRRRVRPKGNCSVIRMAGASARSRSSRTSTRAARKASSSGVPSRRRQLAQRFVGRAQRRQLMEARAAQGQVRDGRAARHQQHVEAAVGQGARQGWRRGADGRCPEGAARGRRRARSRRTGEGHVEAIDGDAAIGARRRRNERSASRACAAAGRSCPSRSPAPAGRGSRPCATRRRSARRPRRARVVQRPRRAIAARGDSPPGGWKSSPRRLGVEEGARRTLMRSSAMVWPSQVPKLISRSAGSMVTAAEGCSSSAVRRARCSGLDRRGQPSAGGGRRQRRASASPAALSVVSVRPCRRRCSFQAVDAWRRMAKGTLLIAGSEGRRGAHGRRRARHGARRSVAWPPPPGVRARPEPSSRRATAAAKAACIARSESAAR